MRRTVATVLTVISFTFTAPASARRAPAPIVRVPWAWLAQVNLLWDSFRLPYTGSECPGRWAIPTSIVWRESHCLATIRNSTSSAGGYYQMLAGTFATATRGAGHPEYAGMNAADVPPQIQHDAARWLVANYGLTPWE